MGACPSDGPRLRSGVSRRRRENSWLRPRRRLPSPSTRWSGVLARTCFFAATFNPVSTRVSVAPSTSQGCAAAGASFSLLASTLTITGTCQLRRRPPQFSPVHRNPLSSWRHCRDGGAGSCEGAGHSSHACYSVLHEVVDVEAMAVKAFGAIDLLANNARIEGTPCRPAHQYVHPRRAGPAPSVRRCRDGPLRGDEEGGKT